MISRDGHPLQPAVSLAPQLHPSPPQQSAPTLWLPLRLGWGGRSGIPLALCPGAQGPEPSAWSPNAPYLPRVSPKPSPAGGQDWPRNLPPRALGLGFPWRSACHLLSQGGRPGHLSLRWQVGMWPCSLTSWAWGPPHSILGSMDRFSSGGGGCPGPWGHLDAGEAEGRVQAGLDSVRWPSRTIRGSSWFWGPCLEASLGSSW